MHGKITLSNRTRSTARKPLTLALIAALGLAPLAASAARITVTSPGDTDPAAATTCTLRQAIITMNHGSGGGVKEGTCRTGATASGAFGSNDTIVFDTGTFPADGSGTIMLASGRLAISAANLTMDASVNSNVTINAHGASGVMGDNAAAGGSLTLKHLTLANGNATAADCKSYIVGGGICMLDADLTLANSTLSDNSASQAGGGIASFSGSVTLTNSTLTDNLANIGGGIASVNGIVALTNSTLSSNSAGTGGGGISSASGSVTLTNSTLSGNSADVGGGIVIYSTSSVTLTNSILSGNSANNSGGGIYSDAGSVMLTNSTLSGNSASDGGGIYSVSGSITLTNSTMSGNSAGQSGGGIAFGSGSVTLTNSSLSGNSANSRGGGIYSDGGSVTLTNSTLSDNSTDWLGGGIYSFGSVTLTNSTLIGNSANSRGGGIYSFDGGVSANNTIVSDNTQASGGDIHADTTLAGSHNLIGTVPNLNLGPLRDNGGPTRTMIPLEGSAAIDAGDLTFCPARDQRGVLRPQNASCDIGAVEASIVGSMAYNYGSDQTATAWHDFTLPLAMQVFGPANQLAPGVSLHATAPTGTGQASATCTDAISNGSGLAYLYCRANGVAGTYEVEVQAVGWPAITPVSFTLTNTADSDAIFRDGFEPPGPRTLVETASDDHD